MHNKYIGRYILAVALVCWLSLVGSVSAQDQVPRLRVANFMENAPAEHLDFYLDDEQAPFVTALGFADASAAVPLTSGSHSIVAVPAGDPRTQPLFTENFIASSDSSVTLYAVRTPGDTLRGLALTRLIQPDIPDERFLGGVLHLAPKLGTIRWVGLSATGLTMINQDARFGRLNLAGRLYYGVMNEGLITSTITRTDITANNQFTDQYLSGRVVTFVLTGSAEAGTLAIYTLQDDDTLEQRPVRKQRHSREGDGGVRMVNLVPDLPSSERGSIRQTIAGWDYRTSFPGATPVLFDIGGLTRAWITLGLSAPTELLQTLDDTIRVNADTLYIYFIVGTGRDSSASSVVLTTPFDIPVSLSRSLLRVLHAAPDIGPVDLRMKYGGGDEETFTNLSFKDANDYAEVMPGPLNVQVYAAGTSSLLFERHGMLSADSAWTLIVSGMEARNSLGINLLNDSDTNRQAPMLLLEGALGVGEERVAESEADLAITPNPASDGVTIAYRLERSGDVALAVYDMTGRLVRMLEQSGQVSGQHSARLSMEGLANGTYQVAVRSKDGQILARGMVIVLR